MPRKIKFRAWSIGQKKMFNVLTINFFTGQITWVGCGQEMPPLNDFVLMQYTGLKDKNGIEIYEGDIVKKNTKDFKDWNESQEPIGVVIWDEGGFHVGEKFMIYLGAINCEVIGNIYENPELLK